jgi:hypothetical protein
MDVHNIEMLSNITFRDELDNAVQFETCKTENLKYVIVTSTSFINVKKSKFSNGTCIFFLI